MSKIIGQSYGNILLSSLGSFWNLIFKDKDLFTKICHGSEIELSNFYFRACEIILGTSVKDIPVFNKQNWKRIIWKKTQINVDTDGYYKYGQDIQYGDSQVFYGGKWPTQQISLKLPGNIINTSNFICNRIYNPSLILYNGKDYTISNGVINFISNIFDNPLVASRNIYDLTGNIIDKEISLWFPFIELDEKYLYDTYGQLLDINRQSSPQYKQLLVTIFSILTNGPKVKYLNGFLNAIFDQPIVIDESEVIKIIVDTDNKKIVYTDKNIYELDLDNTIIELEIGQTLTQFEAFYKNIQLISNSDEPTYLFNRDSFTVPLKLLGKDYYTDVVIKRKNIELENTVGSTFELHWDQGELNYDLEEVLEKLPISVDFPGAIVDGPTIKFDIMTYIIDQIKNNLWEILINIKNVEIGKLLPDVRKILDDIIPAWTAYLIVSNLDLTDDIDTYDTNDIEEDVNLFTGHTIFDKLIINTDIQEGHLEGLDFLPGPSVIILEQSHSCT